MFLSRKQNTTCSDVSILAFGCQMHDQVMEQRKVTNQKVYMRSLRNRMARRAKEPPETWARGFQSRLHLSTFVFSLFLTKLFSNDVLYTLRHFMNCMRCFLLALLLTIIAPCPKFYNLATCWKPVFLREVMKHSAAFTGAWHSDSAFCLAVVMPVSVLDIIVLLYLSVCWQPVKPT